ncbi:MAG: extracellular solute-binding protein [Oscillospiraceae bacterium]|nr:extracellular solute-binding protein [Oscillospiraceae bacterium]
MKKKLLALLLATLMIVSFFAACTNDTPAVDTPATEAPTVDTPATPGADLEPTREHVPPPEGDWMTPFDRPVKILAAAEQGLNWFFQDGDDINNNPWTRLYAEYLNVHVEFEWTTTVDEIETRLNLAIAAGNLPDVFHIPRTADPRLFHELQSQGMLLDLTDAYRNYASQRIRDHELVDPYTIQGFTVDGRIYGIPRYYYGQIDQPWHMWFRKDWYEAAGSPEIRTVADLENLMRTFMNDFGASYGIAVDSDLEWLFRTAPMFGAYIGNIHNNEYFWRADETGRLRPGIAFPEFLVALEYWQNWFAEGFISPDFMTMDPWGRGQEDIVNGLVGVQCWWQWWGWANGPSIVGLQNNDAYFIPFNLPTLDGSTPARGQIFFPNTGVTVASANFQNPAALMKVISLVDHYVFSADTPMTPADIDYFMGEGREHAMTQIFQIIDPHADLTQFQYVLRALETGDDSELFTGGMMSKFRESRAWLDEQDPHGLGAFLQMGFAGSAYARSQHLFDHGHIVQTALWTTSLPEFAAAGNTGDLIMEEVMQIIVGNQPVEHFLTVLEQWYAQGGQIKEDAVNLHFGG